MVETGPRPEVTDDQIPEKADPGALHDKDHPTLQSLGDSVIVARTVAQVRADVAGMLRAKAPLYDALFGETVATAILECAALVADLTVPMALDMPRPVPLEDPAQSHSDRDLLVALLAKWDVQTLIRSDPNEVILDDKYNVIDGFYTVFSFDETGRFVKVGIWE